MLNTSPNASYETVLKKDGLCASVKCQSVQCPFSNAISDACKAKLTTYHLVMEDGDPSSMYECRIMQW